MSQHNTNQPARQLPDSVHQKLLEVRQKHLALGIRTSILAAVGVSLILVSLSIFIDSKLAFRSTSIRAGLTLTTLLVTGGVFLYACLRTWQYRRSLGQLAASVDHAMPELEERWQTLTHLGTASDQYTKQVHPVMAQLLEREATHYEPRIIPAKIVSSKDFRLASVVLGIGAFMLITFWIVSPWQGSLLLSRFFLPFSQISLTKIKLEETPDVIARGDTLKITGQLTGKLVREAELQLRASESSDITTTMLELNQDDPSKLFWNLPKREASFEYRVLAGDGMTAWKGITVAEKPEIAQAVLTLTPPVYSEKPVKSFDRIPRKASTLEGSQFDVRILTHTKIETARLLLENGEHLDLTLQPDGWLTGSRLLQTPIEFTPLLVEPHGLENDYRPRCRIDLIADAKPSVKIVTPSDETAVRPDDKVEIEFQAKDDLGIAAAELVVYQQDPQNPENITATTTPIDLAEKAGKETVNGKIELDLSQLDVKDGQTLTYEVRVYDTKDTSLASKDRSDKQSMQMANAQPPKTASQPSAANVDSQTGENKNDQQQLAMASAPSEKPQQPTAENTTTPSESPDQKPASSSPVPSNSQASPANGEKPASSDADQSKLNINSQQMAENKQPAVSEASTKAEASPEQMTAANSPDSSGQPSSSESKPSESSEQTNASSSSQMAQSEKQPSESGQPNEGATPPPDSMQKRTLDTQQAQSGSSPQMKLRIDEFAGSYEGQSRAKAEQAIAPTLHQLDELLQTAENRLRLVMEERAQGTAWNDNFDSQLTGSNSALETCEKLVSELMGRTKETPYAFVGLQISDIGQAQISPAQDAVWTAIQVEESARDRNVKTAWQLVLRARERLAELNQKFESVKREYKLAELTEQVEKMHQIYTEETMALLQKLEQENGGKPLDPRKMAQYDLDEEYLKHLQEILAKREELKAELARILAEDPRLLKRFADRFRQGSLDMRAQLAKLAQRQSVITDDVVTYNNATDETRESVEQALKPRRLLEASEIAQKSSDLQEDFMTWLPLNYNDKIAAEDRKRDDDQPVNESLAQVMNELNDLTIQARQVQRDAETMAFQDIGIEKPAEGADAQPGVDEFAQQQALRENGNELFQKLQSAGAEIRKFGESDNNPAITMHAVNRLGDLRQLNELAIAWLSRMEAIDASRFSHVFSVEEYRLATETREFTSDLAQMETALATALQTTELPAEIQAPVRELFTLLDQKIEPLQLTTTFALKQDDLKTAQANLIELQKHFGQATDLYNRIINETTKKLDEAPLSDPIAELLQDPTLEELLASLEQEDPLRKLLGIPSRPTNMQIQSDWMSPKSDSSQSGQGGSSQSLSQLVQQEKEQMSDQLENARNSAMQRAKDRIAQMRNPDNQLKPGDRKPWNRLVSELKEGLLQDQGRLPPEQYRLPIDQYFDTISRMGDQPNQNP
ncbi:coiled-coil domain-containing protein [Lacunimicrobium album]